MKSQIIERLGQSDVLLPALIAEGLSANDRVKTRLSVLQAAGHRAHNPGGVRFDLIEECRRVGIDPVAMETLFNNANLAADQQVTAPGLGDLTHSIWDDLEAMNRAVATGNASQGDAAHERLSAIKKDAQSNSADAIKLSQIEKLTALSDRNGDSLHRLIMDLHKALNELAVKHAEEVVCGAHVYGLLPDTVWP